MAGNYTRYPNPSISSNPSVGPTGSTVPTEATLVAGTDGTDLRALSTDSTGALNVNTIAAITAPITANQGAAGLDPWLFALPTGAATSALQTTGNGVLGSILLDLTNGTQITQITGTVPLPTGAATSALQTTGNTSLSSIDGKMASLGQKAMAGSMPVVIASDQAPFPVTVSAGTAVIGKVSIDQTTPGTTNGVQVNAALPAGTNVIGKVSIDQTTPGTTNLVALAANQSVNVAQINGVTPLMGAGNTGTGSQRVTIASDQAPIATKSPVNTNGGNGRISNLTTTAQTLTAPSNTVGFILQAEATNGDFVRWVIGTTATSTVGSQLQPGQDSGYVPCFANISVIANSGTNQAVNVIWILSA